MVQSGKAYSNGKYKGAFLKQMTENEAKLILGLSEEITPTWEEINKYYSYQISIFHPDKGGSRFLTEKIISAKNLLQNNK